MAFKIVHYMPFTAGCGQSIAVVIQAECPKIGSDIEHALALKPCPGYQIPYFPALKSFHKPTHGDVPCNHVPLTLTISLTT